MFCRRALTVGLGLVIPRLRGAGVGAQDEDLDRVVFRQGMRRAARRARADRPEQPGLRQALPGQGAAPVFISEQAKAMFDVKDYPTIKDDIGIASR